jgi:hypothetical protein
MMEEDNLRLKGLLERNKEDILRMKSKNDQDGDLLRNELEKYKGIQRGLENDNNKLRLEN